MSFLEVVIPITLGAVIANLAFIFAVKKGWIK